MRVAAAARLLALPVRHADVELGRPVDVLVDLAARRVLGLEVRCRDAVLRFLPLGAARIRADGVDVVEQRERRPDVEFYRARGMSLRALRGATVRRAGQRLGTLEDLLVGEDGGVDALRVETPTGTVAIAFGPLVALDAERAVSAA